MFLCKRLVNSKKPSWLNFKTVDDDDDDDDDVMIDSIKGLYGITLTLCKIISNLRANKYSLRATIFLLDHNRFV